MAYKFVTRDDLAHVIHILKFETEEGDLLIERLVAEREAYREVATGYVPRSTGGYVDLPISKETILKWVDAEAARILDGKNLSIDPCEKLEKTIQEIDKEHNANQR